LEYSSIVLKVGIILIGDLAMLFPLSQP